MTQEPRPEGYAIHPGGKKRRLLPLVAVISMVLLGIGVWGYLAAPPSTPPATSSAKEKSQMEGLSLTDLDKEGKRWQLKASRAEYLKDRGEILISDILVEFYTREEEIVRLQAPAGVVNTKDKELIVKGGVVLTWGDLTLHTPEVRYLPREHSLELPKEVTMAGERLEVTGRDLSLDLRRRRLVMRQHRLTSIKIGKGFL